MTEAEAASAYAGQLLDALDNLAACGWLDRFGADTAMNVLHVTQSLRPAVRGIIESLLWRPRVDQALVLERQAAAVEADDLQRADDAIADRERFRQHARHIGSGALRQ